MAAMTYEEWKSTQDRPGGDNGYDEAPFRAGYQDYLGSYVGEGGASDLDPTAEFFQQQADQNAQNQLLRPGIPAYGYQAPDYGKTTPNDTHWLNTMNAFAPTARNDMNRLLGGSGMFSGMPKSFPNISKTFGLTPGSVLGTGGSVSNTLQQPSTPEPRSTGTQTPTINPQTPAISPQPTSPQPNYNPYNPADTSGYMNAFFNTAPDPQSNTQTQGLLQMPGFANNTAISGGFFGPGSGESYGLGSIFGLLGGTK